MAVAISGALLGAIVRVLVEPGLAEGQDAPLLASCSSVFAGQSDACTAATADSGDTDDASYVGTVRWTQDEETVVVRIELLLPGEERSLVRAVSFDVNSSETERWEAVGLVLAALVNVAEVQKKAETVPEEAEAEVAAAPPPEPAVAWVFAPDPSLDVGALILGGGDPGLLAGGILARAPVLPRLRVRPTVALGFAGDGSPTPQLHFRPSVGVEWLLPIPEVELALRAEALGVITSWSASVDDQSDSKVEPRFGAALGGGVGLPLAGNFGVFVSGAGLLLFPPVQVRVGGDTLLESGVLGWEGAAGFRLGL